MYLIKQKLHFFLLVNLWRNLILKVKRLIYQYNGEEIPSQNGTTNL